MPDYKEIAFQGLADRIPKRYKPRSNPNMKGLLRALAEGDGYLDELIAAVADNLTIENGEGRYLDDATARVGVSRGLNSGISDEAYRKAATIVGPGLKSVRDPIQRVLGALYSSDQVRAKVTTSSFEPYVITDGDTIILEVDGEDVKIRLDSADFQSPGAATAAELARVFSVRSGGKIRGAVNTVPSTGQKVLILYTRTEGSSAFIRVKAGNAQSRLKFHSPRPISLGSVTWTIAREGTSDLMRYTASSGPSPLFVTQGVKEGDLVTIRTDCGLHARNCGTFEVTTVLSETALIVRNQVGLPQSASTSAADAMTFYESVADNVLLHDSFAAVLSTSPLETRVVLPVNPLLKLDGVPSSRHYYKGGWSTVLSATSTTATIKLATSFPSSGAIVPAGSRIRASSAVTAQTATTITLQDAGGFPTKGAVWSRASRAWYYYSGKSGNQLQNVTPTMPATDIGQVVAYSERFKYTGKTGNQLTGVFPDPSTLVGYEVRAGQASKTTAGPQTGYVYDRTSRRALTELSATLTAPVSAGDFASILVVSDVSAWPDQGYLVVEGNSGREDGPYRYTAKLGTTQLVVEIPGGFTHSHPAGALVRHAQSNTAYYPVSTGDEGGFYAFGSGKARERLQEWIVSMEAEGVFYRFDVREPSRIWSVGPSLYASDPIGSVS